MKKRNKHKHTPETHPPGAFTRPNVSAEQQNRPFNPDDLAAAAAAEAARQGSKAAHAFVFFQSGVLPIPEAIYRLTSNLTTASVLDKQLEERLAKVIRPHKKTSYVVKVDSDSSELAIRLNELNDKLDIANENKRLLIAALAL